MIEVYRHIYQLGGGILAGMAASGGITLFFAYTYTFSRVKNTFWWNHRILRTKLYKNGKFHKILSIFNLAAHGTTWRYYGGTGPPEAGGRCQMLPKCPQGNLSNWTESWRAVSERSTIFLQGGCTTPPIPRGQGVSGHFRIFGSYDRGPRTGASAFYGIQKSLFFAEIFWFEVSKI